MNADLDERMRQALRTAVATIEPPTAELVRGGVTRGRRSRRRRVVVMYGILATATLVTAGSVVVPKLGSAPDLVVADQGAPPAEPLPDGPPAEAPAAEAPAVPRSAVDTSRRIVDALVELLPAGEILDQHFFTRDPGVTQAPVGGVVVFDDGNGAGIITIRVDVAYDSPGCSHPSATVDCRESLLDDGSTLWLVRRPVFPDGRDPERLIWQASRERQDGLQVTVEALNAPDEKDGPVTRAEPPLTLEQLESIATDDRWFATVDLSGVFAEHLAGRSRMADEIAAHQQALAAELGDGWTAVEGESFLPAAAPTATRRAGLPPVFDHVVVTRDVLAGQLNDDPEYLDRICAGWAEKGFEWDACVPEYSIDEHGFRLQRSRSVTGETAYSSDSITVLAVRGDDVVLVTAEARGPADATPEQRRQAVAWLSRQSPDLIRVATAGG